VLERLVDLGGKLIPRQSWGSPLAVERRLQRAHVELEHRSAPLRPRGRAATCFRTKLSPRRRVMRDALFPDPEALASISRKHRIRRLSMFGSTQKGTARSDSDLDLLVEFEPHAKPGLIGMARIEIELSSLLNGRKVDLRTAQDLSRYFRDEVLRTATPQYAA
jgi:predicted nucleotidyltransferase